MKEPMDLGAILRKTQEELQGYVLDLAKIGPMNDRQLEQFSKSIKKHFRHSIDVVNETIKALLLDDSVELVVSDRPPYNKETNSTTEVIINE